MIIKLPNEGDTLTMKVAECEVVAGNYGQQVKFTGSTSDIIFLPQESADRQLARIPLSYEECVGNVLTFSRDHNPKVGSKPFWGIKLGDSPAPSKRIPPPKADQPFDAPTDEEARFEAFDAALESVGKPVKAVKATLPSAPQSTIEADYTALFERVAEAQARIGAEYNLPMDGSSVQTMTFSIFNLTRNAR